MIKIITDSSCDLPESIINDLGVTVVPLFVRFGDEIFKERVTISDEQFYDRLVNCPIHPVTIQPSPADFISAYEKTCQNADGIISIHISAKLSGTPNSAIQAKSMVNSSCPIEVVDSETVSIALGTVVIAAAEAAKAGKNMEEVLRVTRDAIANNRALCLLDTLKYLQAGGRIGKAQAFIGTLLNIKPIITIKDGIVVPYGRTRSFSKGQDQLASFIGDGENVEEVLLAYTTADREVTELSRRIASVYSRTPVKIMRLGTTLGVHVGPGAIVLAVREKAN